MAENDLPSLTHEYDDFDYIGTGGFLIACGENSEILGVTREQAELATRNCPFFDKCLGPNTTEGEEEQGGILAMKEATSRIIHKPDWSLAIARHFIEILTKGKTTLPTLELVDGILAAGDQSVVDLRLSSMINYLDPCSKDNKFCSLVDPVFFRFRLRGVVKSDQWLELLNKDILLYREETNYVVQLYNDRVFDREQSLSRRKLDTRTSDFLVHSERPIQAMFELQKCLSMTSKDSNHATEELFCIYFETTETIPKEHHELIDRLAGGEAYIRTCADAAEYQTEGYTVRASLDVLARAIQPIQEDTVIHCSFRVDCPTPDTLGRFVNACRRLSDYPGTLGLDASINRYFCRKSMKDVKAVLEYMKDYSRSSKLSSSDFQLFLLSSESESF